MKLDFVEKIRYFKGKKTMIVISRSLATGQHCDLIYGLENGEIVETSTPDQVLNTKKAVRR